MQKNNNCRCPRFLRLLSFRTGSRHGVFGILAGTPLYTAAFQAYFSIAKRHGNNSCSKRLVHFGIRKDVALIRLFEVIILQNRKRMVFEDYFQMKFIVSAKPRSVWGL